VRDAKWRVRLEDGGQHAPAAVLEDRRRRVRPPEEVEVREDRGVFVPRAQAPCELRLNYSRVSNEKKTHGVAYRYSVRKLPRGDGGCVVGRIRGYLLDTLEREACFAREMNLLIQQSVVGPRGRQV
jgi:hypothetical protein